MPVSPTKWSPAEWSRVVLTAFATWLFQRFWMRLVRRKKQITDIKNWNARVDLENIQACLLSTVNLASSGRIEKQTIMTKKLSDIFSNEHVRNLVLEAASKTTRDNPFIVSFLKKEDRWNVLVAAMNHISSIFGPYHLFSNVESSYESCWYVFTLVGVRTRTTSQLFVNNADGAAAEDGDSVLRLRLHIIEEQELRRICVGEIVDPGPDEMFSDRHRARWLIMQRFAEMFEKQLRRVTELSDTHTSVGSFDVRTQSWGSNLCGTAKRTRSESTTSIEEPPPAVEEEDDEADHIPSELNCLLRIHVPVPLLVETSGTGPENVVLYE